MEALVELWVLVLPVPGLVLVVSLPGVLLGLGVHVLNKPLEHYESIVLKLLQLTLLCADLKLEHLEMVCLLSALLAESAVDLGRDLQLFALLVHSAFEQPVLGPFLLPPS